MGIELKPDSLDLNPRCGFNVVLCELHKARRLRAWHSWTESHALFWRTVTQHSTRLRSGSRPCGGKVVFESGFQIHTGSGSKVPCGEPVSWAEAT